MAEHCAVIGVGQTQHDAKRIDVSQYGLVREAAARALEDAGLTYADIDAVVVGTYLHAQGDLRAALDPMRVAAIASLVKAYGASPTA